jgi:hypothetical protein
MKHDGRRNAARVRKLLYAAEKLGTPLPKCAIKRRTRLHDLPEPLSTRDQYRRGLTRRNAIASAV